MTKKIIGLSEFRELAQELQFKILHKDGVHVGKRIIDGQMVILLQLYGFYVEVYYEEYRKKIHNIITSDSTDILQPYLDQINIRDLNKNKGKE